ncbi:GspH/FimT family pseudopilin [Caenimonas koreensis]|uniref:GspH/FimT family pseudopilin n=1 Tax=Caenimonas koreensis TaxID=367474 RepID=UPI003784D2EB
MQKQRGFTLIELMVVLAITALLITLAAPSFKTMIQSNAISSSVNGFQADLRYARSEAIRLGGNVVMCRSDAPDASPPACGAGAGPGNNGWVSGWIIFHDRTDPIVSPAVYDDGTDTLLRVQPALTSPGSIVDNPSGTVFRFTATGRLQSAAATAKLTFGGSGYASSVQRVVCVGVGGRARIAGDGTKSCGADNE